MLLYFAFGVSLYMAFHSREKMSNNITYWYEESRKNIAFNKYPPCYDICGATRNIYDIFEKTKLINDYYVLLNVYSVILCQEAHAKYCREEMVLERLRDLKNSGGNELDRDAQDIVRKHTKLQNNHIGFLLVLATSIIIKELRKIVDDKRISDKDKKSIMNLNETFYKIHYDKITQLCHLQ